MKRLSVLFAFLALVLSDVAFGYAIVTSTTGTTQVQTGTGPARPLRLGDQLNQGDTVSTGASSSLVFKFEDGQVTALTSNSRMTITGYNYDKGTKTGSMLLSLVTGGMRAITGLIGKNSPQNVSVRAATATIGIRGTTFSVVVNGSRVAVTVSDGSVTVRVGDQTVTVAAGTGAMLQDGRLTTAAITEISRLLGLSADGLSMLEMLNGLGGLQALMREASPGDPLSGGEGGGGGGSSTGGPPTGGGGTGGGGGGGRGSPS